MKKDITKQSEEITPQPKQARRELFGSGVAAASMMFGLVAAACSDDDDNTTAPSPDGGRSDAGGNPVIKDGGMDGGSLDATVPVNPDSGVGTDNDIAPLKTLQGAEFLAIAAYTAGAQLLDAAIAANTDPLVSLAAGVKAIALHFQSQHALHAAALGEAITALGGVPVVQSTVVFTPPPELVAKPTVLNVLKFAASAERGAATAYNAVLATFEAASNRFLATIIEGDESQHFIVLTALVAGLASAGPNLGATTIAQVVPDAFVRTHGSSAGLDSFPVDYFAA
jgi:bacterioferritin (cytochrome b1)